MRSLCSWRIKQRFRGPLAANFLKVTIGTRLEPDRITGKQLENLRILESCHHLPEVPRRVCRQFAFAHEEITRALKSAQRNELFPEGDLQEAFFPDHASVVGSLQHSLHRGHVAIRVA